MALNNSDNNPNKADLGAPNLVTNNTADYMDSIDHAWQLGCGPTTDNEHVPTITKAIGNGQLGVGVKAPALDVATPLVLPPAVIVVLQVPGMYTVDGYRTAMAAAIKDMFESHAKNVTGIEVSYTLDAIGDSTMHDGQNFQAPGKTKRAAVNPSFTFTEITGNLYWNIIKKWITDINNPDTYAIGANTVVNGGWTMSAYSMTIAVIQPDVTGRPDRILDASIICNMFPQGTGEFGMSREIGNMKPMDRSFTFSGIQQHNSYTKQIGKLIMQKLSMHELDFDWAPPQRDIWTSNLDNLGLGADVQGRRTLYERTTADENGNVDGKIAATIGPDSLRSKIEDAWSEKHRLGN